MLQLGAKLWVHKEGHFQMHKYEKWGEVWEEWKHKGAIVGPGKDGPLEATQSYVVSRWIVTQRDINRRDRICT